MSHPKAAHTSLELRIDLDCTNRPLLKATDLVGLEGCSDDELKDWLYDWASDEALRTMSVHVERADDAVAWIKTKLEQERISGQVVDEVLQGKEDKC